MKFIPFPITTTKFEQSFEHATLFLPSLSIGNIGQLSIDLLIYNFNLPKVGYIDSKFVLPVVGNDTFAPPGTGSLSINLEVYFNEKKKIVLLQQRAPIIEGCKQKYVEELMNWVKQSKFKEVLILNSSDSTRRIDSQLFGPQIRYVCFPENSESSKNLRDHGFIPLEQLSYSNVMKKGSTLECLYQQCKLNGVPFSMISIFCYEGNNIPEAVQLSECVNQLISLSGGSGVQWKQPPSWLKLEENVIDPFIYS